MFWSNPYLVNSLYLLPFILQGKTVLFLFIRKKRYAANLTCCYFSKYPHQQPELFANMSPAAQCSVSKKKVSWMQSHDLAGCKNGL